MIFAQLSRYQQSLGLTNYLHPFVFSFRLYWPTLPDYWTVTFGAGDDTSDRRVKVVSVFTDVTNSLIKQLDFASVVAQESSFYWDDENQIGYVHLDHDTNPDQYVISAGFAQGFCDGSAVTYIGDVEYLPLIQKAPTWRKQVDFFGYEKMSFASGSMVLSNGGEMIDGQGIIDDIIQDPLYGNEVFILYGDNPVDDADLIPLGVFAVKDYTFTLDSITLKLKDLRESQNIKVPTESLTSAEYQYLDEGDEGAVVPLIFGTVRSVPCVCIDRARTSGTTRRYKAASVLTAISAARLNIDGVWVSKTPQNIDLANGEFDLPLAVNESYSAFDCVADVTGIAVSDVSDILTGLFSRYLSVAITESNYNTAELAAEGAKVGAVGVVLSEKKELFSHIADLQRSARVGWWFMINAEGKRTLRADNPNRTSRYYIQNCELANSNAMEVAPDPEKVYSAVNVSYNKNWEAGSSYHKKCADYYNAVVVSYRSRAAADIDTFLSSLSDATIRALIEAENYSEARPVVELDLMGPAYYDIREADVLTVELTPAFVDADTSTVTGRTYFGVVRGQVLSVSPDFSKGITKVELRVRPWSQIYEDNIGG